MRDFDTELERFQKQIDAAVRKNEAKDSYVTDNLPDRRQRYLLEDGEMTVSGAFEDLDPSSLDWISLQSLLLSHVSGRKLYHPEYSMVGRLVCDILTPWLDSKCEPELKKEFDDEQ